MPIRERWIAACRVAGIIALFGAFADAALSAQEPISLQPKDGLVCLLVNKNSGRCLSVLEGEVTPGSKIVQGPTPDKAGPSEHWAMIATGNAYRLRNEKSGLVLQIWASNLQKGSQPVLSADQVNAPHQHWTFEPSGDCYLLRAGHSQLVLGVAASALEEGARVIQWNPVPNVKDQLWVLRSTSDRSSIFEGAGSKDRASGSIVLVVLLGTLVLLLLFAVTLWVSMRRRAALRTQSAEALADQSDEPHNDAAPMVIVCGACGKKLKVKTELEGKKVKCVQCGQPVRVQSGPKNEPQPDRSEHGPATTTEL